MSDKPFNINASAVRVSNTPPTITNIAISPASPIEGDELLCAATASDVDFDVLDIRYRWDGPDGFVRNDKIDPERLTTGLWICTATASDGDLESTTVTESVFVDVDPNADDTDEASESTDTGMGETGEQ